MRGWLNLGKIGDGGVRNAWIIILGHIVVHMKILITVPIVGNS